MFGLNTFGKFSSAKWTKTKFELEQSVFFKNDFTFFSDRDTVSRVLTTLSSESPNGEVGAMSISMFKINGSDVERDAITKTLSSFSPNYIGKYFCVQNITIN